MEKIARFFEFTGDYFKSRISNPKAVEDYVHRVEMYRKRFRPEEVKLLSLTEGEFAVLKLHLVYKDIYVYKFEQNIVNLDGTTTNIFVYGKYNGKWILPNSLVLGEIIKHIDGVCDSDNLISCLT